MEKDNEKIREIISSGEIKNKAEFYLLYDKGLFGNRALAWGSYDGVLKSGWKGQICVRGWGLR